MTVRFGAIPGSKCRVRFLISRRRFVPRLPPEAFAACGSKVLPANPERLYRLWVRENEPSAKELRAQRELSAEKTRAFTLITYVAEPAGWSPQRTVQSVLEQSYPHWEWIVAVPEESIDETTRSYCSSYARSTCSCLRRAVGQHAGGSMERRAAGDRWRIRSATRQR